ncbi:hypothetical protein AWZ03_004138 [Drosophila navojoa]|uniref:Uncharacterized protein n=1 Tax=Drosophila navojoa TaxID=7232 RepID=A0A484BNK8_DRONA|nr:hypothetical protein AWZ03_004138 [Drosophila navojoa]
MLTDDDDFFYEDKMGMTVSTNAVVITKDQSNLIGISIGGGAPMCPCLYIVQVNGTKNNNNTLIFTNKNP